MIQISHGLKEFFLAFPVRTKQKVHLQTHSIRLVYKCNSNVSLIFIMVLRAQLYLEISLYFVLYRFIAFFCSSNVVQVYDIQLHKYITI